MRIAQGFVVLLLAVIASCNTPEEVIETMPGPEYFPLRTGTQLIYNVDSTRIIQNISNNFKYQLRLSVVDSFRNEEGNYTYVILRHKRADATKPWTSAGTWSAWKSIREAVVNEGNTSYIKLTFPLTQGVAWNGNALNSTGGPDRCNSTDCDTYEATEVTGSDVLITQNNDTDVIVKKDIRIEKYRKSVGLIYKETTVLEYCTAGACLGQGFVTSGLVYKQELIDESL